MASWMYRGYLLDTQVMVWVTNAPNRIGVKAMKAIETRPVYFSSISVAELGFKRSIGKFEMHPEVAESWTNVGIKPLSFDLQAAAAFARFPASQVPDPMDRQIMATAAANNLILLTSDRKILSKNFDWVLDATT